jgi:dGTPase
MFEYGGFEHNLQSLRVVDHLEERYPEFDGLNLTFETREGVLKHCSRANALVLEAQEPNGVASRFLRNAQPSLEAQLCNLADEIAYNAHDIDDGVRSGLITLDQLQQVPLFDKFRQQTLVDFPHLLGDSLGRRLLYESIRRMLSDQVYDVIATTSAAIAEAGPDHVDAVRRLPPLVQFSADMRRQSKLLKAFLLQQLYRHPQVLHSNDEGKRVVRSLFDAYMAQPAEMPERYRQRAARLVGVVNHLARTVADYIAGMTDRFALHEHTRMTGEVLLSERL